MTYVKRFSQGEYSIKPSPHVQFFQDGLPVGAIDFRYIGPAFDAEGGSILDRYYYRCGIFQLAVAERNQLQREDPKIDVAREVTESIVDQLQRQEPAFALKTIVSISPSVCAGQLSHPAGVVSIVCSKLENQREQYAIVVSFSAFSSLAPEMIVDIKKNGTMVTKPTTAVFP